MPSACARARSLGAVARAGLVALTAALPACNGCRDDHPYVPYSIDVAPAPDAAEEGDALAPVVVDAGPFHAREGAVARPGMARWTLDGLDLVAPADHVFALGLTADLDGDGARDAVALVVAGVAAGANPPAPADPDAGVDPGEIVLYRGGAAGLANAEVIAVPAALPDAPGCAPRRRLAQVGLHSIAVETGASCDQTSAARWVAALSFGAEGARAHFQATLRDPPLAPALAVDVDGSDRDGDGLDDVTLRVSLEGGGAPFEPGPRVTATLRWFDRPAGMSRDPDEPDASFRGLASAAAVRAAKPKDAPGVPRYVEEVRALYRALCVEGGSPRVVDVGGARGAGMDCGTSKGLEEAGLAEVRAYALSGDPLRAIAALDRAQLSPATHTTTRTADAQAWIAQSAPPITTPSVLRAISAVPQIDRGRAPAWGALAFEPSGKLLVRTVAGTVRVDPVSGDEAAAPDVPSWRSAMVSPSGAYRWVDAHDACDGLALHATFAPNAGGDVKDVPLPIAPPLGSRCADPSGHGDPAPIVPIAWGQGGVEAVVAGEPLLVAPDFSRATLLASPLGQPVTPGAPRSPSGKVLVVPTTSGVFVRGTHARLLRAKELDGGYLELRDCAVSDDGARVACVRGGRAFVGVWAPE